MSPLRKAFNKAARIVVYSSALTVVGLYVEDKLSDPGYSVWDGMKLSAANTASNDSCAYAGHDEDLRSKRQKALLDLYNKASQSQTGKTIMDDLNKDGTMLCFKDSLNQGSSNGLVTVGAYHAELNFITLNPSLGWQDSWPDTLVHEGRHHQQEEMYLQAFKNRHNYRPSDQMIVYWITEADARLVTILHNYEMMKKQGGNNVLALPSGNSSKMARAFMAEMRESQDIQEAMRASIRAFRDQTVLARSYDKKIVKYLEEKGHDFDPDEKTEALLTDENLIKLGEIEHYGNYMNEELMQFIRESVTMDDYRNMRKHVLDEKQGAKRPSAKVIAPVTTS